MTWHVLKSLFRVDTDTVQVNSVGAMVTCRSAWAVYLKILRTRYEETTVLFAFLYFYVIELAHFWRSVLG
jgi:hypothetical protein